jgi:hypothetical protein
MSGHADAINSCHAHSASGDDLRDQALGSLIGATGAACTEVVTTKASAAKAINLIIRASHVFKKEIFLTRG